MSRSFVATQNLGKVEGLSATAKAKASATIKLPTTKIAWVNDCVGWLQRQHNGDLHNSALGGLVKE